MASKGWQTVAWSYGLEDSRISLFQYATQILSGSCDVDVGFGSNLGQWSPPTPTGLSASATGNQTTAISWNSAYVTTSYTLNRATSSSGPWTQIYSGAATQYSDSGLQIGTTYYYEVSANNGGGSSSFSSAVSATTSAGAPTGLIATAAGPQSISCSWNAVSSATSYTLDRANSSSGPWSQVYAGPAAQYGDSGLQSSTTYYYEVCANSDSGSSPFSAAVSATTFGRAGRPWRDRQRAAIGRLQLERRHRRDELRPGPLDLIQRAVVADLRRRLDAVHRQRIESRHRVLLRGQLHLEHGKFGILVTGFRNDHADGDHQQPGDQPGVHDVPDHCQRHGRGYRRHRPVGGRRHRHDQRQFGLRGPLRHVGIVFRGRDRAGPRVQHY